MYLLNPLATVVQSNPDDGLTLAEVFENLPSDPASIFVLLLLVGCFAAVVWFGGRSNG